MTSGVKVIKYGGGGLLVFLESLIKGSWGLSYIFLITLHSATFITVDDPTLLHHRMFVLWGHQEVFDGSTSFKVYLNPIVAAFCLNTLTQPLVIWYSYVRFGDVVLLSGTCFVSLFLGWGCSSWSLLCSKPIWGSYSSSMLWISDLLLAAALGCWNIWFWLCEGGFQQHYILRRLYDDCPTEDIGLCGLASCILLFQALPSLSGVIKMSRKGNDPLGPGSSVVKLDITVHWIYVGQKFFLVGLLHDDKGVINKPLPQWRGVWWWL